MSRFKGAPLLLALILLAFLSREIFLALAFPPFTGQDEARHYNTVQWLAEDQNAQCLQNSMNIEDQDKENLATYRFSDEIRETSTAANLSIWREENYRKPTYLAGKNGSHESQIQARQWSRNNPHCPPDIVPTAAKFSFFHWVASGIERVFADSDILTRFYLIRILAVLLGAITILLAYWAAIEAGFSRRIGLLVALILSLQPRLSIYTTNINYDVLLIPCFTIFLWAGLRCLQRGFTTTNIILLTLGLMGATLTKGTGLVLFGGVAFFLGWLLFMKRSSWKELPLPYWIIGGSISLVLALIVNNAHPIIRLLPDLSLPSLLEYLGKSLPRIPASSENFWGTLSWNEAALGSFFVYAIWIIEALALYGLIRFFYLKENFSFLPLKSAAIFCLVLIFFLQLGVRFHDWHVFQETGSLALGTPGRYFLPTIAAQIILIAIGLGALLRRQLWLERSLIGLALIMLAFNLYTIWLIIIPRFYL